MTLPREARGPRGLLGAGGAALLVAATGALWVASRGKWSDALIDSGREWIVPDALARGDLLYRDVVYWFGPLTPYLHALLFRVFGASFSTLVLAGVAASGAILAALYLALRQVTARLEAILWTAVAIPALVFMPHAGGPLLGMGYRIWHAAGLALLAVAVVCRPAGRSSPASTGLLAGTVCAAAGLCRLEWGLAALTAVGVASGVQRRWRGPWWKEALFAGAAFLAVTASVLGFFIARAGPDAVIGDGHVLLTGLPEETRRFLVAFSGVGDWRRGVAELLYSAAMWTGLVVLLEVVSLWKLDRARAERRLRTLVVILPILLVTALLGGASGAVVFSAAPLVSLAALLAGLRRPGGRAAAALAAFGVLGLALSYRRPFHIGDSAYVGPPLLFALVCAAGLLRRRVASLSRGAARARVATAMAAALAALGAIAFAARAAHYTRWEGVAIEGTGGWLSARPGLAEEISELADVIRRETPPEGTLVVFPEGEIFNALAERGNPLRHKLYIPGYLSAANEEQILAELSDERPSAVIIWRRPTSEYGPGLFGEDYGTRVRHWIEKTYRPRPFASAGATPRRNPIFLYGRLGE